MAERLRKKIPRQLFEVAIQAAVGSRIIARETRARRCARTCWPSATAATSRRKRKLLEKQKAGKKRMKMVGTVEIPQEAFLAVLDLGERRDREVTVEYVVLGVIADADGRRVRSAFRHCAGSDDPEARGQTAGRPPAGGRPAGKFSEGWTAVLGSVGAALWPSRSAVLGVLGR